MARALVFVFLNQEWLNWKMESSLTVYGLKNSVGYCALRKYFLFQFQAKYITMYLFW